MYERGDKDSRYNRAITTYKRQLNKAVVQARVNIMTANINERLPSLRNGGGESPFKNIQQLDNYFTDNFHSWMAQTAFIRETAVEHLFHSAVYETRSQ